MQLALAPQRIEAWTWWHHNGLRNSLDWSKSMSLSKSMSWHQDRALPGKWHLLQQQIQHSLCCKAPGRSSVAQTLTGSMCPSARGKFCRLENRWSPPFLQSTCTHGTHAVAKQEATSTDFKYPTHLSRQSRFPLSWFLKTGRISWGGWPCPDLFYSSNFLSLQIWIKRERSTYHCRDANSKHSKDISRAPCRRTPSASVAASAHVQSHPPALYREFQSC